MTTSLLPADPRPLSGAAIKAAQQVMPGGVSSPVRAYRAVGSEPVFAARGRGAMVVDLDGNEYVDYVASYGPLILGHTPPSVVTAIREAAGQGTSFGMPTTAETTLASMIRDAVESIDLVRFVSSGTEAVMSAVRLARAATGRARILKCVGGYHGHCDSLLVQAGSGVTTLGIPSCPGIPEDVTNNTLLMPYNDLGQARRLFEHHGPQIACLIIEPIAGNMGCIPPSPSYLEGLRSLCDASGTVLIFDEIMSGFRVAYGGAAELYHVQPDLTCLGKVIGGGLPCAAYGGRANLMRQVAPDGPVYQAGTLSGNPLAMAAGIATLEALRDRSGYAHLEQYSASLVNMLQEAAQDAQVPVQLARVGSMICCFFTHQKTPVKDYDEAVHCNTTAYSSFFHGMLDGGVVLPPSQFETWFVSTAHDDSTLEKTRTAAKRAFATVRDT